MGCGSSAPQQAVPPSGGGGPTPSAPANNAGGGGGGGAISNARAGASANTGIEADLARARLEDEGKIKMLLLGAGESGKSTIFKQMRLLYNSNERTDDDLRMYGVVARSNIVVAVRKLCAHLRNLGLEEELDREEAGDQSSMSVRQAYDELMAYLVDNTANLEGKSVSQDPSVSEHQILNNGKKDWVGQSARAGGAANNDAKLFLDHHESIRILWQVSTQFYYLFLLYFCLVCWLRSRSFVCSPC